MPQPPFQALTLPIWLTLIFIFFFSIPQQGVRANGAYEPYLPNSTCVPMSSLNETMGICWSVLAGRYEYVYSDSADAYRAQMFRLHSISALVADKSCTSPFAVISCMLRWRECVPIEVPGNVTNSSTPVAINVARDLCIRTCELTTSSCASFLAFLPLGSFEPWQISNCTYPNYLMWTQNVVNPFRNPTDPYLPITLYLSPNETVIYEINLPCFYLDPRNFSINFSAVCPSPLIYDPTTGACTVGCPLPLISDNDYETLEITMSVLGWLSFVLTTILIATYLLDPHRRSYPAVLPLFFIFCTNATSFAFCLGSMVKHEDVWCKDDGSPNEFGGGACTVQEIIWVYFTLAGVLWWLMIVVNMLVMMLIPNALQRIGRWHYCYHIVWILPVITLIISLSAEKLGYGGDVWCSVHIGDPSIKYVIEGKSISSEYDEETYLWNLLLIVIPILLMVILGTIIVVSMVVYMIFKWRQFGWSYVLLQWRLFLFTFFYIYIYTFLFVFEIIRIAQTPDQYDSFIEWISCTILETNLNSAGIYGFYTCNLDQQVSFPLWYIVVFNASCQGIVVFGIFGTSWRMYKGWYNLVMHPRKIWSSSASSGVTKNSSESLQKIEGHQHLNSRTEEEEVENDEREENDSEVDSTSTEEEGEGTELQEIVAN